MAYRIINTETRTLVGIAQSEQDANRQVGALNKSIGSTCRYGWQYTGRRAIEDSNEPINTVH
jgi:hypothetical protein